MKYTYSQYPRVLRCTLTLLPRYQAANKKRYDIFYPITVFPCINLYMKNRHYYSCTLLVQFSSVQFSSVYFNHKTAQETCNSNMNQI